MRVSCRRIKVIAESCQVSRPVALYGAAIAVLATIMAFTGWHAVTAALGAVLVMIVGLMFFQVRSAVRHLHLNSQRLSKSACQAEKHYVEVLWRMLRFVEAGDKYTEGHSERVSVLCEQLARQMSLPKATCENLRLAGKLHDLGMIAIPGKILAQRSKIGVADYRAIKRHPEIAYEVLKPLQLLTGALPAIRHHHERMNGTGYPAGLSGEEIPIEARVLAVADAYDAMTHDRPHQPAITPLAAMTELQRCSPAGYAPRCVDALATVKNLKQLTEAINSV